MNTELKKMCERKLVAEIFVPCPYSYLSDETGKCYPNICKNKGFPGCNLIPGRQAYETRGSRCSVKESNTGRQCERVLMKMFGSEGEEDGEKCAIKCFIN